ncbi:MAG: helix-hairpin-helix domain-containing protein [Epsilonproteobacteria bacterium]|nr:MAG: helix-hairpin-helix domain-containing protein [Campylobacterota bacterium]
MKFISMILLGATLAFGAVDINKADATELQTLNGVGAKKAQAIIEFRKTSCFKNVDALSGVKGISTKTIEKNRKNLKASKCKAKKK